MPQAQDLADLVSATLQDLGRPKFTQIAQSLQSYVVMSDWLKRDVTTISDGYGIKRAIMDRTRGVAKHVGLYESDDIDIGEHLTNMEVPWVHAQTHWAYEEREMLINRGKSRVTDVIQPREAGAMLDMASELEDKAFDAPSTTNSKLPYGIQYWVVKNATTGFNGGAYSGFSTVAGVDVTAHPNFKNYTGQYAAVSKADLIKKMRTASRKTNFESPVPIRDARTFSGTNRIYVNEATLSSIEDLGEAQNENLGRDIASMDGKLVFHGIPFVYVPKLDSDTTNPVYMIDTSTFYPVVLKDDNMRRTGPVRSPDNHNVWVVWYDLSYNYVCVDRRRNTVLYV